MNEKKPSGDDLYGPEYAEMMGLLGSSSARRTFTKYLEARRDGAARTMLMPNVTPEQLQIIRGKAQAFWELLAICEAAKAAQSNDEGDD